MRASAVRLIAAGLVLAALAACSPKLPKGVDEQQLSEAVGRAIGGPNTCVLLANKAGKVVWTGGGYITCARNLPTCGGTTTTAQSVLEGAVGKPARFASCPSGPGANTVGWAMGPVPVGPGKPDLGLSYVAVMEGERALPGREVQERIEEAFAKAGL
ncbi:hypothetical protein ASD89_01645 [Caulobacter sp. Root656]|nr:hypothetical protein ASD89_01645 [Caulobacter sp. Root656]